MNIAALPNYDEKGNRRSAMEAFWENLDDEYGQGLFESPLTFENKQPVLWQALYNGLDPECETENDQEREEYTAEARKLLDEFLRLHVGDPKQVSVHDLYSVILADDDPMIPVARLNFVILVWAALKGAAQ